MTSRWADREARIVEATLVASVAASALLVPTLFALREDAQWRPQLGGAWAAGGSRRATLLALTCALPLVKTAARTSKYHAIAGSSAFAFEFIQSASAIASAVANVLLYGERVTPAFAGAAALLAAAFGAYIKARAAVRAAHAAEHLVGIHHRRGEAPGAGGGAGGPGGPGRTAGGGDWWPVGNGVDAEYRYYTALSEGEGGGVGVGGAGKGGGSPTAVTLAQPSPRVRAPPPPSPPPPPPPPPPRRNV
jgi:hypothetical protein